jgi:hypothetical protein
MSLKQSQAWALNKRTAYYCWKLECWCWNSWKYGSTENMEENANVNTIENDNLDAQYTEKNVK